jgi:peptide chain release factor 1
MAALPILDPADIIVEWFSGSGNGGSNRNKVQACARLRHLPTGLVRTAQTRSRNNSYRLAFEALAQAVAEQRSDAAASRINVDRRQQIGSGERSDKRRSWRFQDNAVLDHVTGKRARLTDVIAGRHPILWP